MCLVGVNATEFSKSYSEVSGSRIAAPAPSSLMDCGRNCLASFLFEQAVLSVDLMGHKALDSTERICCELFIFAEGQAVGDL